MRPLESHRRVSSFAATGIDAATVAPVQTTLQNASCAPSLLRACWRTVTPKTCWATNTAASRWTPVSASSPRPRCAGAAAAIARVHRFPWSAAKGEANARCTAVPNSAKQTQSINKRGAKADRGCTSHRWSSSTALPPGTPTTHPPAPATLVCWHKLAAESSGNGAGSACCVTASHGGDCTTWRGRTGVAAWQRPHLLLNLKHARSERRITCGGADCPHLRGISAAVPHVRWQMRIIAFITHSAEIRHIPEPHRGGVCPPHITRHAGHRCGRLRRAGG